MERRINGRAEVILEAVVVRLVCHFNERVHCFGIEIVAAGVAIRHAYEDHDLPRTSGDVPSERATVHRVCQVYPFERSCVHRHDAHAVSYTHLTLPTIYSV